MSVQALHPRPSVNVQPRGVRGGPRSFEPVDEILSRYLTLFSELNSVPALDLVLASSSKCVSCGLGSRVKKPGSRRKFACSNCEADWIGNEFRVLLRGEVDRTTKKGNTETRIVAIVDRWREVRPLVEPAPTGCRRDQWNYVLLCWSALLDKSIGTATNVSRLLRALRPNLLNSVFEVSNAIVLGRTVVKERVRIKNGGGDIVTAETELLGASEAADLLGLPSPNGRRQTLRYMKQNLVKGVMDTGTQERQRLKAPRWAWLAFQASRRVNGLNGQNGQNGQNGHSKATGMQESA